MGKIYKHWSLDSVKELASKCKSRSEFISKYAGAYEYAKRHNILDSICLHMKNPLMKINRNEIIKMLHANISMHEIAKKFDVTNVRIQQIAKENNIFYHEFSKKKNKKMFSLIKDMHDKNKKTFKYISDFFNEKGIKTNRNKMFTVGSVCGIYYRFL